MGIHVIPYHSPSKIEWHEIQQHTSTHPGAHHLQTHRGGSLEHPELPPESPACKGRPTAEGETHRRCSLLGQPAPWHLCHYLQVPHPARTPHAENRSITTGPNGSTRPRDPCALVCCLLVLTQTSSLRRRLRLGQGVTRHARNDPKSLQRVAGQATRSKVAPEKNPPEAPRGTRHENTTLPKRTADFERSAHVTGSILQ